MPSKPGRLATKGTLKKGVSIRLDDDKALKTTGWVMKYLDQYMPYDIQTMLGYEQTVTWKQHLALKLLKTAALTKREDIALAYIREILDRTEGKPMQKAVIEDTNGNNVVTFTISHDEQQTG